MNNYCVYIHTNTVNGKRYVGMTCQNVSRRWRNGDGYIKSSHFYRAIQKYGWDAFTHEIVKAGLSKSEACELEKKLIAKHNSTNEEFGYNRSSGGEHPAEGAFASEETKRKMSEAHKGFVMAESTKQKLREKAIARGNGMQGKVGKECGKAGLVRQIDLETGAIIAEFYGYAEMERRTGFGQAPIKRVVKGTQKQSHGYMWEYIPRRELNVVI